MAKKEKRVPNSAINRNDNKSVRLPEQKSDSQPVWRFSTVDKSGLFKWPKQEKEELFIVGKLHEFDSMTWQSIMGKQHHFLSFVKRQL